MYNFDWESLWLYVYTVQCADWLYVYTVQCADPALSLLG